jgi:glycosyltransferase involved in cell wall biosynthesis
LGIIASANTPRPTVLVLLGAYWPGHEATGPVQSLTALCRALSDEFDFKVVARDRPFGAGSPSAFPETWGCEDFAQVRYCPVSVYGAVGLRQILLATPHDVLLLNGFFDREFTIPSLILRRSRLVPRRPTIMSPRGEFSAGALALKKKRKRAYLAFARRTGLLADVWLHTTGQREFDDVRRVYPWARGILQAPNVRTPIGRPTPKVAEEIGGAACRLAYLGRIARVKNLDYALRALRSVRAPVEFDIFGPISEPDYWAACGRIIATLPANVKVRHVGSIANSAVPATLARYHLFFMPTRGENFGHAIFDALAAGLPVLISDQTPWQDVERQEAGWSLPLDRPERFAAAIDRLAGMSAEERSRLRKGALRLAERVAAESDALSENRTMFRAVLGGGVGFHGLRGA